MTNEQKLTLYAAEVGNAMNNGKSLADNPDIKKIGINANTILENGPLTKTNGLSSVNNIAPQEAISNPQYSAPVQPDTPVPQETMGIPGYGVPVEPTVAVTQETFANNLSNPVYDEAGKFMATEVPSTEYVPSQNIPVNPMATMPTSNEQVVAPVLNNDVVMPQSVTPPMPFPEIPTQQSSIIDTIENPTLEIQPTVPSNVQPLDVEVTSQAEPQLENTSNEEMAPTFEPIVESKVNESLDNLKNRIIDQINSAFAEYEDKLASQENQLPVIDENPISEVKMPKPVLENSLPPVQAPSTVGVQAQNVQPNTAPVYGPGTAMDYNTFFSSRK